MRIVRVSECLGRRWAVSPRRRTVYYLATLSPTEVADAVMDGVAALAEHDSLPKLQLVHSTRLASDLAAS